MPDLVLEILGFRGGRITRDLLILAATWSGFLVGHRCTRTTENYCTTKTETEYESFGSLMIRKRLTTTNSGRCCSAQLSSTKRRYPDSSDTNYVTVTRIDITEETSWIKSNSVIVSKPLQEKLQQKYVLAPDGVTSTSPERIQEQPRCQDSVDPSEDLVLDLKANADGESDRGETAWGQNGRQINALGSAMKLESTIESNRGFQLGRPSVEFWDIRNRQLLEPNEVVPVLPRGGTQVMLFPPRRDLLFVGLLFLMIGAK